MKTLRLFVILGTIVCTYRAVWGTQGLHIVYEVSGTSHSQTWMPEALSKELKLLPAISQKYSYTIQFTYLTPEKGKGWLQQAEWGNWQVDSKDKQPYAPLLQQILQLSPVYCRRGPDGQIYFFSETHREAWTRQAVAGILWPFQFVRPTNPHKMLWRVQEAHPSMPVLCRYQLVRRSKNLSIYQKKVERVFIDQQLRSAGVNYQIEGRWEYRIDSSGLIVAIQGRQQEKTFLNGSLISKSIVKWNIRQVKVQKLAPSHVQRLILEAESRLREGRWWALYAPLTEEENAIARARGILGNRTAEELLSQLDHLNLSDESETARQQRTELSVQLEAATLLHPKLVSVLAQRLQACQTADAMFWFIAGILTYSQNPEAQKVLVNSIMKETNPEKQAALARQIAFLSKPTKQTFETLWEWRKQLPVSELRDYLDVSLGSLARHLKATEPLLVAQFADWSTQHLQQAIDRQDIPAQLHWLAVIGNIGDNSTLEITFRLLRSGTELVRKAAVESLRFQDARKALKEFLSFYLSEPAIPVREAIVQQAGEWWRHREAQQLIEKAVFGDPSVRIRLTCVKLLQKLSLSDTKALNLLVQVAERNSEERVRREAMIALAALHAQGIKVPSPSPK